MQIRQLPCRLIMVTTAVASDFTKSGLQVQNFPHPLFFSISALAGVLVLSLPFYAVANIENVILHLG